MGWLVQTALLNLRPQAGSLPDSGPYTVGARPALVAMAPALLSIVVLVGAVVVVAVAIGVAEAAAWVAFGVSIATVVAGVTLALVARRQRRLALAFLGILIAGLAAWTVIATAGVFGDEVTRWIAFGSGVGYIVAAIGALGVHELNPARVVHVLEVRGDAARG